MIAKPLGGVLYISGIRKDHSNGDLPEAAGKTSNASLECAAFYGVLFVNPPGFLFTDQIDPELQKRRSVD